MNVPLIPRLARRARMMSLRRTTPIGDAWGYDRGQPIDRFYIERFLTEHRNDIRGDVLEVKEPLYVERFGTGVVRCEVLDVDPGNEQATIVADLGSAGSLPSEAFDCIVLTQTLQYVAETASAVRNVHGALRRGGVLLATVPGVNRADEDPRTPSLWSFTEAGCKSLFGREFDDISVRSHGNVLSAVAFLFGMARHELAAEELEAHDERFPVIVAVRGVRS